MTKRSSLPTTPPSVLEESLYQSCRSRMERGSLSFFAAARLLGRKDQRAVTLLYAWCRYCDDRIDGQNLGHRDAPVDQHLLPETDRTALLNQLMVDTKTMMTDPQKFREALFNQSLDPALLAMGYLAHHRGLPYFYAEELLKGMAMDLQPPHYQTLGDLKVYGYHVAGVVGVMFSHLVGLRDPMARELAAELGIAMQLTNIARDIIDDAKLGRIYLPREILKDHGLPQDPESLLREWDHIRRSPEKSPQLFLAVQEILTEADRLYATARSGLKQLPWRAAWAAGAACYLYQAIGTQILNRKNRAWVSRTKLSKGAKIAGIFKALLLLVRDLPFRISHPWKLSSPQDLWRYFSS